MLQIMRMKNNITGRVSIKINAPAARVWEALTTPAIIKQYFFGTTAISHWKVGSPIVFKGEWKGKEYEDKGTILDIVPNRLFRYSYWSSMSGIEDKPEKILAEMIASHAKLTARMRPNTNTNETLLQWCVFEII